MKRVFAILASLTLLCCCAWACSTAPAGGTDAAAQSAAGDSTPQSENALAGAVQKIAFCSDVGSIDDESFNQYCYAGVENIAKQYNIDYTYYIPAENTTEDRVTNIRQAVSYGATTIVCAGYMYAEALAWAANEYPDINFIGVDLAEADYLMVSDVIQPNVLCIVYQEDQAGFLAGYATVQDGYRNLGFIGGMAVPSVVRFGYGFVQGCAEAAKKLNTEVSIQYYYCGQFFGDESITARMEGWYQSGVEAVFACGGGIYTSVVEAAENNGGKVIGVDVDQYYISESIITSALKGHQVSIENALSAALEGSFRGGTCETLGLAAGAYVGIPTAEHSWRFESFTVSEYEEAVDALRTGAMHVSDDITVEPEAFNSEYVTVTVVK